MERFRLSDLVKDVEMGGDIDVVIAADAQRALDAEREKVKELERDNAAMKQLFHANPSALWGQLASLQAQLESANVLIYKKNCALGRADTTITDLQAQLAAAKKVKADYDRWLSGGVYFTTAEYEKRVAGHKQQVQALQAQLRQVEGERDQWIAANTKEPINEPVTYQALAGARFVAKRAFDELVKARSDLSALRQLVEVHTKQLTELTIIPIGCSREQELRWTQSIKDLRAALADVDAALQPERGRND